MSQFLGPTEGHIVIPGSYTAAGGTTNFNFNHLPSLDSNGRKREPFSTVPFAPDPDFVDRPETLAWIRDKCTAPGARAALVGLGGVGKSQLAIHYAHGIRDATPRTFVFWVHAGTKARFEEGYREIADRLELPGRDDPKINVLGLVNNWLCDESNGQWVIILDNADDVEVFYPKQKRSKESQFRSSVKSLADYLPQSRNGSILITSRNKDTAARLAGGYHNIKEVHTFDENQALKLLRNKLQNTPSDENTVELLRTLDYIPLAITQAAAYINRHAPRATISSYLDEFHSSDKSKENLLNHDTGDIRRDRSASNAIVTAWQITFNSVRKESRSAVDMLSLMSFFNPQEIPEFALQSYRSSLDAKTINTARFLATLLPTNDRKRKGGQMDYNADIGILQIYSLIDGTTKRGVLKMHPLVQFCTRAWLSSSGKLKDWGSIFLTLMTRELSPKNVEDWMQYKQLVPHLEVFYQSKPAGKSLKKWIDLVLDVQSLLIDHCKFEEARTLGRQVIEEREKNLGGEHPDTLTSVSSVAIVLYYQGKYEDAEIMYRRALEGREKALGNCHLDTLDTMNRLALVLEGQGKYEEAEAMNRQALEAGERALGKDHPVTLTSVGNLSLVLRNQGKNETAEMLSRRALEGNEKVLGKDHLNTLWCLNCLALVMRDQGKYEEAEKMTRRVLEGKKKALGEDHPDTLGNMSNLALVLWSQGKHEEAESMNQRALEGREKVLGKYHPDTLGSMNNLALVLRDQGKYEEAEVMNRRALEGNEKILGKTHPETLNSIGNLALVLRSQRKYEEAEMMSRQALEGSEKVLGKDHPNTLSTLFYFAYLLHEQKKFDDARGLYCRACDGLDKILGASHPKTIECRNNYTAMMQEEQEAQIREGEESTSNNEVVIRELMGSKDSPE